MHILQSNVPLRPILPGLSGSLRQIGSKTTLSPADAHRSRSCTSPFAVPQISCRASTPKILKRLVNLSEGIFPVLVIHRQLFDSVIKDHRIAETHEGKIQYACQARADLSARWRGS